LPAFLPDGIRPLVLAVFAVVFLWIAYERIQACPRKTR
jgi:hypothetical protein